MRLFLSSKVEDSDGVLLPGSLEVCGFQHFPGVVRLNGRLGEPRRLAGAM